MYETLEEYLNAELGAWERAEQPLYTREQVEAAVLESWSQLQQGESLETRLAALEAMGERFNAAERTLATMSKTVSKMSLRG